MRLPRASLRLPAQSQVQSHLRRHFPVILRISAHVVVEAGQRFHVFEAEVPCTQKEARVPKPLSRRTTGELVALRISGAETKAPRWIENLKRIETVQPILPASLHIVPSPRIHDVVLPALRIPGLVVIRGAAQIGKRPIQTEVREEQDISRIPEVRR